MTHPIARPIEGVSTITVGMIAEAVQGPMNQAVEVNNLLDVERAFGGPQSGNELFTAAAQFFENGGRRAWIVRPSSRGPRGVERALAALDAVDDVRLLCLPNLSGARMLAAGAAYARSRGAFFLADPRASRVATLESIRAIRRRDAGHVALYLPRIRIRDRLDPARTQVVGPAASVTGILVRTDLERGVWTVAAGSEGRVRDAVGLTARIDDGAAATLRGQGVNVIREVPGHGILLWGARTVGHGPESAEELRYIAIRRLALFIEQSIEAGLRWVVFEPNDEPTWTWVRKAVEPFMLNLMRQGAFAGQTPDECYFVRCGLTTMTEIDIRRGILVIEVGVAPLRPAEFVVIRIRTSVR